MFRRMRSFLSNPSTILGVYITLTVVISTLQYLKGGKSIDGVEYTSINNFLIFKTSFFNLINGSNLYLHHPQYHFDLYKYSPTFALLFAPIAILPVVPGYILWSLVNALGLLLAVRSLPSESDARNPRVLVAWFVLVELTTSMQNSQSNGLMAALLIGAYALMEKKRVVAATLCIVLSVYIKLFGAVAFSLMLLYPHKRKFVLSSLMWFVVLAVLPLTVVFPGRLVELYKAWLPILTSDHAVGYGLSIFGFLHSWFGFHPDKFVVLASGVVLFCIPFIHRDLYASQRFRSLVISSVLLWVIVFNHMAESPTFIIAMSGVGIWYFCQPPTRLRLALLLLAFVFTTLSPTDLFPPYVRTNLILPFYVKAVPCILVWFVLQYQLIFRKLGVASSGPNEAFPEPPS